MNMNPPGSTETSAKPHFTASDFSSRKLFELVASTAQDEAAQDYRLAAIQELAQRKHYLTELADRGLISKHSHH
jgi:hypothetical protein